MTSISANQLPQIKKRAIDYTTLAEALADPAAKAGDYFAVMDYATGNNSGVLFFRWVAPEGTADGGSLIDHDTLSLQAKQNFPAVVSVKMFGAVGDGINDDTASSQAALNHSKRVVFTAGKYKTTAALTPQDNATIEGARDADYLNNDSQSSYIQNIISDVINVSGVKGATIKDLSIYGSSGYSGITGGGTSIQIERCNIKGCGVGIGSITPYGGIYKIVDSHIHSGVTGIINLIDSDIISTLVYNNSGDGIKFNAGANDNRVIGGKLEWNGGYNLFAYQCGNISVVGTTLDRSSDAGVYLDSVATVSLIGMPLKRNSANQVPGRNCHFYIKNSTNVVISACPTSVDDIVDGAPSGIVTPDYVVVDGGGNVGCQIIAVGGTGVQGFIQRVGNSGEGLRLLSNPNYRNRQLEGGIAKVIANTGGTADFDISVLPVSTYSRQGRKIVLTVRDANGTTLAAEQTIVVVREGGSAIVVSGSIIDTAGTSYSTYLTHSFAIDQDSGVVTMTITNNRAYDATVTVEYE